VLSSALGALTDRIDSKFLTAYWLPAFVAGLGGLGILAVLVGPEQMDDWIYGLDSVEQSLAVLVLLLAITMLAFVLRALTRPITEIFAGQLLPRAVAEWSTRGQLAIKHKTEQILGPAPEGTGSDIPESQAVALLNPVYPRDDADTQPTLFGNVLAAAADHPWLAYAMRGTLWWPRLTPLLPSEFQSMMGGALAPMMSLLNLSVVFVALGIAALIVLGLYGGLWVAAIVWLVAGMIIAWFSYRAAVSQAAELGSMLRVAFDLYRYEILSQWNLDAPSDISEERTLWERLTNELLGSPAAGSSISAKQQAADTKKG
jgi:hypothetical protein